MCSISVFMRVLYPWPPWIQRVDYSSVCWILWAAFNAKFRKLNRTFPWCYYNNHKLLFTTTIITTISNTVIKWLLLLILLCGVKFIPHKLEKITFTWVCTVLKYWYELKLEWWVRYFMANTPQEKQMKW